MAENNNDNSLILTQNNLKSRVENSIQITNKILNRNISELFNTAFCKMNSKTIAEVDKDYLFLIESSSSFRKNELFEYKANTKDDYYIALDLFSKILKINPNHILTKDMAAICKIKLKQFDEAIDDYNQIIDYKPNYQYAFLNRAIAIFSKTEKETWFMKTGKESCFLNKKSEIFKYLNQSIKIDIDFAEAYLQKGLVYFDCKMYDKSFWSFSKAIEINSNYTMAYYRRGLLKKQMMDYNGAIEDLNKAISLDSKIYDAFYIRGVAKFKLNDQDGALQDFLLEKELNLDRFSRVYGSAVSSAISKDYAEAIEKFSIAILVDDQCNNNYYGRGLTKLKMGDYYGAIEDLTKCVEIDSINIMGYRIRSQAFEKIGDFEQAANDMLIYNKLKNK